MRGHGEYARYTRGPDEDDVPGKGCRCTRCCAANTAAASRRAAGIKAGTWQPYVDAGPAREHVRRLAERGVILSEAARRSGVRLSTLYMLVNSIPSRSQVRRVTPKTEAAILAVPLPRRGSRGRRP